MREGARLEASTSMVSVIVSPGTTIPIAGETISHAAPAVAVNEIGAPLVVRVTVCTGAGFGGAVKLRLVALKLRVDGAAVTCSVTFTTAGAATPATVMVTEDKYAPTARLVGFTITLMVAGRVPALVFTVSQKSAGGVDVVNVGLPVLGFTVNVCALGRAEPCW